MTDEPLSLDDELAIDAVCVRFEAAYRAGEAPSVDAFAEELPERLRGPLRSQLEPLREELERGAEPARVGTPERIGSYRIVRRIGQGGMGTVYEAVQDEPQRRVALKVVRADLANERMNRRFRREIGVLGHLHHPGIAQIFEAGTDRVGGVEIPYLAMEFVDGKPLLEYAAEHRLDVGQRVALVRDLCFAIQHAHDQGVVHRDLKPANVVVRESHSSASGGLPASGRPVVLDFGVARAAAEVAAVTLETQVGQIVGTLSYMSPEQLRGEGDALDERTDVYALGAVLYELLSGSLPIDLGGCTLPEAIDRLGNDEPRRLGRRDPRLRGDVEIIAAKALAKDAERRYGSAREMAEDLQRFLDDVPIRARRPSAAYQLSKFARRNRGLVAGFASSGVLLLLALVVVGFQAARQAELRVLAETERDKASAIADFQRAILARANADEGGRPGETTLLDALDLARAELEGAFPDAPLVEASLRFTLAQSYHSLERIEEAEGLARAALEAFRAELGERHEDTLRATMLLGRILELDQRLDEALELLERARAVSLELYDEEHPRAVSALNNLAGLYEARGDFDESEAAHRRVLELRERLDGERSEPVANTANNLASLLENRGRLDEAEALYRRSLDIRAELYEPPHKLLANVTNNLGSLLLRRGRLDEAQGYLEEALTMRERLFGPDHPQVATSVNNLAVLENLRGNDARSLEMLERALAIQDAHFGVDHPGSRVTRTNVVIQMMRAGRNQEAYERQLENLRSIRSALGDRHMKTVQAMDLLASLEGRLGKFDVARARLDEAIGVAEEELGDHRVTAKCHESLGVLFYLRGRFDEGFEELREAVAIHRRVDDSAPGLFDVLATLAELLGRVGRTEEALDVARGAHLESLEVLGQGHAYTRRLAGLVGSLGGD